MTGGIAGRHTRESGLNSSRKLARQGKPHHPPPLSEQEKTSLEKRMNAVLEALQVPLRVVWLPSEESREHSRIIIEEGLIVLHDGSEDEAWRSLFHEILEYRFRSLISPYRELVNKLIEAIEKITYEEKERVLDQVMNDFMMWKSWIERKEES